MSDEATTVAQKPKEKSLVEVLHEEWVKGGKKEASPALKKSMVSAYLKAKAAQDTAKAALEKHTAEVSEAATAIIRTTGKGRKCMNGDMYVPMARGKTVFFRLEGGGEFDDLGKG